MAADLAEAIALVNGDPEPKKLLFSRRDDVTLANPVGRVPARGWAQVEQTLVSAASRYRDGDPIAFERVAEYATADLAYIVEIERWRARPDGADRIESGVLRATTIFRREEGGWRIAHRHADSLAPASPSG